MIDPLNQCWIQTDRVFAIRSKHSFYNGKCLYCGKLEKPKQHPICDGHVWQHIDQMRYCVKCGLEIIE